MTHAFDKDYWSQVWQGDVGSAMADSAANPHLVGEVVDLTPGSALEAGSGGGAEAIWLAGRGWQVTAADISADALAGAAGRGAAAGVGDRVQWVEADLSTWEPGVRFDLVTTHYAHPSIPQLAFYDRLASWVAPGGTLFIVGHLQHGSHGHGHGHGQGHGHEPGHRQEDIGSGPPAAASVTAAEITARLDPAAWEVVTARETQRTMTGRGGRAHVVHDVVVRATRRG